MTQLLILGGSGMLGHKLWQTARGVMPTAATVRSPQSVARLGLPLSEMVEGVDANDFDAITRAIESLRPSVVVNCIGIVKQLAAAHDPVQSITINALFPHRVAAVCRANGARMIHISTDCVFTGRTGNYRDGDIADAEDLYGRTKLLGEVGGDGVLTMRTSIIGRELGSKSGLSEWFRSNQGGRVRGFDRAVFSGFTTIELSRLILSMIERFPRLSGVFNVSADPINKYDVLTLARAAFAANIEIDRDSSVVINRALDSSRFREVTGYRPPSWPDMIRELAEDPTPYPNWRSVS